MVTARHILLVLFAFAGVFACASSETAGNTDAATDAATTCALKGGSCGACCAQTGSRYDEGRDCVSSGTSVIGCAPIPASTNTCAFLGVTGCAVTMEGTSRNVWFTFDRAAGWEPTEKCPDAVAAKVQAAKPCPTTDAGADAGP